MRRKQMEKASDTYNRYATSDKKLSRALYRKYFRQPVMNDADGKMCDGEYYINGTIARFKNGFLHGGVNSAGESQPAIESNFQNHIEWWTDGRLHREEGPAVITEFGNWEEFWIEGTLQEIRCLGSIGSTGDGKDPDKAESRA
jgi:hypothetical protein